MRDERTTPINTKKKINDRNECEDVNNVSLPLMDLKRKNATIQTPRCIVLDTTDELDKIRIVSEVSF